MLRRLLLVAAAASASTESDATPFCAQCANGGPPPMDNTFLHAACNDAGATIAAVAFASYGTATGTCPAFAKGACDAASSASVVQAACVGQRECFVYPNSTTFGDPCIGTFKTLTVALMCSSGAGTADCGVVPPPGVFELSSPYFSVQVTVGSGASADTYVSSLSVNQAASTPGFGFTTNMLFSRQNSANSYSRTGIWVQSAQPSSPSHLPSSPSSVQWFASQGGRVVEHDSSTLRIEGVQLGDSATETWSLALVGDSLEWNVSRVFARAGVAVTDDWLPSLVFDPSQVTNSASLSTQMPGWLDLEMELDSGSSGHAGFRKVYNSADGAASAAWYTLESANAAPNITLSPSGMELATESSCARTLSADGGGGQPCAPRFVWARPSPSNPSLSAECYLDKGCVSVPVLCPNGDQVNGGPSLITIGLTSSVRGAPVVYSAGDSVATSWRFSLRATHCDNCTSRDVAPLLFDLPGDPQLAALSRRLASVMTNPVAGWSVLAAAEPGLPSFHSAFAKQLAYYGEYGVTAEGYVQARWDIGCAENFSAFAETNANFLLSAYHHAVNTGDRGYASSLWDTLALVASYLTGDAYMRMEAEGVPLSAKTTGIAGEWAPSNWYDEVDFGGFDAIVGAYSVAAMEAMSQLAAWVGRPPAEVERFSTLAAAGRASYNARFFNESAGLFNDWVDLKGNAHTSHFWWQQFVATSALANISSPAQRVQAMAALDAFLARIQSEYNVTSDELWCLPDNQQPLPPADCNGNMCSQWPGYENGLCFLHVSGWHIYARARSGDADGAYSLYQRMLGGLESNYSRVRTTRFWAQGNGWGRWETRAPTSGSDVLLDQIVVLWGFLRGCFGIEPTLSGIDIVHPPATQLEGAVWSFQHLGQQRTATVKGGAVVLS